MTTRRMKLLTLAFTGILTFGVAMSAEAAGGTAEQLNQEEIINEIDSEELPEELPEEVFEEGWLSDDMGYRYRESDGTFSVGWKEIGGCKYYFNEESYMVTGWQQIDGFYYWFGGTNDGSMKYGWEQVNGIWYYFGNNGSMQTGWQEVGGNWYYLGGTNDGSMKYGWEQINGIWYYFGTNGSMQTGWQEVNGNWYYLGTVGDGSMKYGWEQVNGIWYYLGDDGIMRTGVQEINGIRYCFGAAGDGAMKYGWEQVDSNWYYLGDDGIVRTGMQIFSDAVYVLKDDGVMLCDTTYKFNGANLFIGSDGRVNQSQADAIINAYNKLNVVGWDLRSAFNWSASSIKYYGLHKYGIGPAAGDIHSAWYANYGFKNNKGNCYVMAATFCYMARLLGYEAYYVEGQVPLAGGGMGPHGWCEIVMDGSTYVFDPDFTHETGRNGYQICYGMSGTWRYTNYKHVE